MTKINLDKPKSVRLEACTLCQLKCKCCYMRNDTNEVGFGYLKFDDFVNFIRKNDYINEIELSNSGEIFLNPDLLKIIKFAHEIGVKLSAYNGVNLNSVSDEMLEALVKYKFDRLTCSIDGASQETYSQYRVGGNFDKVISNIRKINEFKDKYNSVHPIIKYQFIIFGHNEHEISKAKDLAKELRCDINFKLNWDRNFSPIKNEEFVKKEIQQDYVSCDEYLENEKEIYLRCMCVKMWTQPQINWDGRLLGCCILYKEDFGVNVFEVGLEAALTSEKFMYAKKMLMNKVPAKEDIPCAHCFYYQTMVNTNSFVKKDEIVEFL